MSVTLIAVVAALVLGHAAPSLASVRQFGWYRDLVAWLNSHFDEDSFWRGNWGIALALAPPLLAVGLLQRALDGQVFGLASLLFAIIVLFYSWGPRDLDRDVDAVLDAPDPASRRDAAARLADDGSASVDGPRVIDAVFRNGLRRWFGVLFWFLVLGPFGALGYRLVVVSARRDGAEDPPATPVPSATARGARRLLALLEWPVAQLMTLSLALVGNFDSVLGAWRSAGGAAFHLDSRFLEAAGRASVRSELADESSDYAAGSLRDEDMGATTLPAAPLGELPELRDAMSLVWRCLLVWLATLALFVIAGFVS